MYEKHGLLVCDVLTLLLTTKYVVSYSDLQLINCPLISIGIRISKSVTDLYTTLSRMSILTMNGKKSSFGLYMVIAIYT